MRASGDERPRKRLNWILILFLLGNLLNSFGLILAYLSTHISPNSFPYLSYFGLAYPIMVNDRFAFHHLLDFLSSEIDVDLYSHHFNRF